MLIEVPAKIIGHPTIDKVGWGSNHSGVAMQSEICLRYSDMSRSLSYPPNGASSNADLTTYPIPHSPSFHCAILVRELIDD